MSKKIILLLVLLSLFSYLSGAPEIRNVTLDKRNYYTNDEALIRWEIVNIPLSAHFDIELLDHNQRHFCFIEKDLSIENTGPLYKWKIEDRCYDYYNRRKEITEGIYYVKVKLARSAEISIYAISNPFQIRRRKTYTDAEGWETVFSFDLYSVLTTSGFRVIERERGEDEYKIKEGHVLKVTSVNPSADFRRITVKLKVKKVIKEPRTFQICVKTDYGETNLPPNVRSSLFTYQDTLHLEGEKKEFTIAVYNLPVSESLHSRELSISLIVFIRDLTTSCNSPGIRGNLSKTLNLMIRIKPQ